MPPPNPPRIFISYRRDDAELAASRLAEDLRRAFKSAQIFQDVASIDPGADFVDVLQLALESCSAALVVIGPNWLSMADKLGSRRLDNPKDWVRREVAACLQRSGLRVFPVLVGNARMPGEDELPEPLQPLARRQAFELTTRHWSNDISVLITHLERSLNVIDGQASLLAPEPASDNGPTSVEANVGEGSEKAGAREPKRESIGEPRWHQRRGLRTLAATATLALLVALISLKYYLQSEPSAGAASPPMPNASSRHAGQSLPTTNVDLSKAPGDPIKSIATPSESAPPGLDRIKHIIVIYVGGRSFDHLYGMFPDAEGISNATPAGYIQLDHNGEPMPHLPPVWKGNDPARGFPKDLPNKPFRIDAPPVSIRLDQFGPSPVQAFWQNQEQIASGANNRFAAISNVGGWVMGYFDGSPMKLWQWAREYTLADHFFQGAFGGAFLNHFWLVCACTPEFREAPPSLRAQLNSNERLRRRPDSPSSALTGPVQLMDGAVTPDGFAVNTLQPAYQPSRVPPPEGGDPRLADPTRNVLPPQTQKTIGDTLTAKGITWAWYAGAWNLAVEDATKWVASRQVITYATFQPHHQPFNYFARFAPGTSERNKHLKDYEDFVTDIARGSLPQVTFYKPHGAVNQHPGTTDVFSGDQHIADVLAKIKDSLLWDSTVVIIAYDDNGGFWDHVPPPKGDRWGPGSRVPALVVSPLAKRGYVDHTPYDTTSIIKFITLRFGLEPLPGVRARAGDLTAALNLKR